MGRDRRFFYINWNRRIRRLIACAVVAGVLFGLFANRIMFSSYNAMAIVDGGFLSRVGRAIPPDRIFLEIQSEDFAETIARRVGDPEVKEKVLCRLYGGEGRFRIRWLDSYQYYELRYSGDDPAASLRVLSVIADEFIQRLHTQLRPMVEVLEEQRDEARQKLADALQQREVVENILRRVSEEGIRVDGQLALVSALTANNVMLNDAENKLNDLSVSLTTPFFQLPRLVVPPTPLRRSWFQKPAGSAFLGLFAALCIALLYARILSDRLSEPEDAGLSGEKERQSPENIEGAMGRADPQVVSVRKTMGDP